MRKGVAYRHRGMTKIILGILSNLKSVIACGPRTLVREVEGVIAIRVKDLRRDARFITWVKCGESWCVGREQLGTGLIVLTDNQIALNKRIGRGR